MGVAVVASPLSHPQHGVVGPGERKIWLILILIFALTTCFYDLENHPDHLSGWEVSGGISALQLFHRIEPGYAKLLWSSLERPLNGAPACPFFVFSLIAFFKLFGTSVLVIRSVGVFWGLVSLVILYRILTDLFGRKTALFAILLTSTSPWFLSIARYGGYVSLSLCYVLLVILFFLRGVREGKHWNLFITGVLSGLFSYFYLPVKIIFPLLALCWLHSLCFSRIPIQKKMLGAMGFLAGFFLISMSLGNPFPKLSGVAMPHTFLGSPLGKTGFSPAMAGTDLMINLNRLFYNLFYRSHSIAFPAPNTLLVGRGILFPAILGVGICVRRWKQIPFFFLALTTVLTLLPVLIISSRFGEQPLARQAFFNGLLSLLTGGGHAEYHSGLLCRIREKEATDMGSDRHCSLDNGNLRTRPDPLLQQFGSPRLCRRTCLR